MLTVPISTGRPVAYISTVSFTTAPYLPATVR